jgi:ATP-dependent Lon protease
MRKEFDERIEHYRHLSTMIADKRTLDEIVPVSRMDEVLAHAMTRKPEPIEWTRPRPPQWP